MDTFNLQEAKKKFSEIVDRAAHGEHIGLTAGNGPLVVIGPPTREMLEMEVMSRKLARTRNQLKKISR